MLSQEDKRDMARKIYNATPERERNDKKAQIAKILSVSERTIRDWLSRIDKDTKEARNRRIFDMWMACWTQEEIADAVEWSQGEVAKKIPNATDFTPPIYNIWKQQEKTAGSSRRSAYREPRKTGTVISKADALIDLAKRVKDWPLLETAVDHKLAEQEEFVRWWKANLTVRHGNPDNADRRSLISAADAEAETGISQQQVSKWHKRLADREKYRAGVKFESSQRRELLSFSHHAEVRP